MTDPDLDALFAAARADLPMPTDALVARIMADAAAVQPRASAPGGARLAPQDGVLRAPVRLSGGWLNRLAAMFGGSGALAGVSLAMVAGVFIGIVQPAPVAALTSALLVETQTGAEDDRVDLFPAAVAIWEEVQDD